MVTHGTNYRIYTEHLKGTGELVSWIQRRCLVCKRFLGKREQKFCKDHRKVNHKESMNKYLGSDKYSLYAYSYREVDALRHKVYSHADEFKIGDYI